MAWTIEKVKPTLERRKKFPYLKLIRYRGSWYNSAYGMFWIAATTEKEAVRKMKLNQADMFADRM